jgi:FkbM family methyltransferase
MELLSKQCRHGKFYYASTDELVGFSLDTYGEFSEFEVSLMFKKSFGEGDVVLDVGAQQGGLTVPMANIVGPSGKVIAIEPGVLNASILRKNIAANGLTNVEVVEAAASDRHGTIDVTFDWGENYPKVGRGTKDDLQVQRMMIDDLKLERLKFMKVDVDGHEIEVIRGARETIRRCQPFVYIENEHLDKSRALIAELVDLGYRMYWFRPPLYNPDNYFKVERNVFPQIVSIMMICVPEESPYNIKGCDEVSDLRLDDQMYDREIARYEKRLERKPDDLEARCLVGYYNACMQREREAFGAFEENLRRDPEHVPSKAILGLLKLQRGDWSAWKDYELRFLQRNKQQFGGNRKFDVPHWDGTPTDEPVLIWCEQGFGDSIMFARFMKHVLKRAPNAFLEVQPQLYELFEYSNISPNGLYRKARTLPGNFAFHCSLPSTPATLGADAEMMRVDGPYLFADPAMTEIWNTKNNPRIGLCVQGSERSERPYTRDMPHEVLMPVIRKWGPGLSLAQTGQYDSFMDTAAAISSCDLVLSVDTSVAHLAAAMGIETWLLLSYDPDFRWGLTGERTIWYPSMRIFRQHRFRDWESVVHDLEAAFAQREQLTKAA